MKVLSVRFYFVFVLWLGCLLSAAFAQRLPQKLPEGYVAAPGTSRDAVTGLPKRILHRASGIALVLIPAGEFLMGSPPQDTTQHRGLETQHRRVIRQPFYLGETEVTVAQFRRFVAATKYQTDAERGTPLDTHRQGSFASESQGDREWSTITNWRNPFPNLPDYRLNEKHPVVHVSWNDAQQFSAHYGFQLPTEAQWEYAARAGTQTRYFWGDDEAGGKGYANVTGSEAKRRFPSRNQLYSFDDGVALLASVGRYRPNAWGLYDMVGNVLEWVEDRFVSCYPGDGADESAVRTSDSDGHGLRGGSWLDGPDYGRSAVRVTMVAAARRDFIGFRVAKAIAP